MKICVKDVIFAYSCVMQMYMQYPQKLIKGVQLPFVKFEERCNKCGTCEVACPDQAITVDLPENWWMNDDNNHNFNPKFTKGKSGC